MRFTGFDHPRPKLSHNNTKKKIPYSLNKAVKEFSKKWTHKMCGKSMACFEIQENVCDKRNSVNYWFITEL